MNIYLSKQEQDLLRSAAKELGTTQAYVVRLALRVTLGLPIGEPGEDDFGHIRSLTLDR